MYLSNTKVLHPCYLHNAEYKLPLEAELAGVVYDYTSHLLIVGDNSEQKLLMLNSETATVEQSMDLAPKIGLVIDICAFRDTLWILHTTSEGELTVFEGSIYLARDTGIVDGINYDVPHWDKTYYKEVIAGSEPFSSINLTASLSGYEYTGIVVYKNDELLHSPEDYTFSLSTNVVDFVVESTEGDRYEFFVSENTWDYTHSSSFSYLNYNPKFCSIFNMGTQLYLVLGITSNASSSTPPNDLGQWLVQYDKLGSFISYYNLDTSPESGVRYGTVGNLNGTHVASTYHDGVVTTIGMGYKTLPVMRTLYFNSETSLSFSDSKFLVGDSHVGTSLAASINRMFIVYDNRLYTSDIIMFDMYSDNVMELRTTCVDVGVVTPSGSTVRQVDIENITPVYTMKNIVVRSNSVGVALSENGNDYYEAIYLSGIMEPGDVKSFYVMVTPYVDMDDIPTQFLGTLSVEAQKEW